MRGNNGVRLSGTTLVVLFATAFLPAWSHAGSISFTVDLRTGEALSPPSPFIAFEVAPEDTNGDGYFETVLRINLNDPGLNNPYVAAVFQVEYDAEPAGQINVNIGDSRTNNGGSGDSGTQSNDAEIQIGDVDSANDRDLFILGKDGTREATGSAQLARIPNFAVIGQSVELTVSNEFLAWDNNQGVSGSLRSPFLFALDGQPDTEGPVNYDIYAAFNRVIDGPYRLGSGVGRVTVTLVVPEPTTLPLVGSGLTGLLLVACLRAMRGAKAGPPPRQGRVVGCEVAG